MWLALDWLEQNCSSPATIVTDSQSLCEAIQGYNPDLDLLRLRLRNTEHPLSIQWVPGHSDVPGNELADQAAKLAAELEALIATVTYGSIC